MRLERGLILGTVVLLAISFVGGEHLQDQPLHHIPTAIVLVALWVVASRHAVSGASVVCILIFLWLHILGARYIYSFVPYDDWSQRLLGISITETFGFRRNHYDRLVHVAYGVLAFLPQVELFRRRGVGLRSACALSVVVVLAASALYELAEWSVAMVMAPDWAERYNGQQGDPWDAQKDMALALLGSLVMAGVVATCGITSRCRASGTPGEASKGSLARSGSSRSPRS